ncbi:2474_t:CDS:2, partial [Racocetra fulgida]
MNNAKISNETASTPANQVQPISTRFTPNIEAIQNALNFLMDTYEAEGVAILKQYGIKNTQDPKEQAVLLGIASTIMPTLLTKYSDLLAVDSTGHHQKEFDERKVIILDAEKLQNAIGIMNYFKKDMLIYYQERYTKSLHANLEKIRTSMHVDAEEIKRLHAAAELDDDDVQYAAAELDDDELDDNDVQHAAAELDDNDVSKESSRLSESREIKTPETNDDYFIKQHEKLLCVTRKNGKFACPCSFNIIRGHDCQDIAAVCFFINELEARKSVPESTSNTSLESYIHQKNVNSHSKDELKLPQKRGPKNKRKSRLVPGESIQLRDTTLYEPYHKVQIVEIIGDGEVIVDVTLENGDKDQRIIQLANIIRYDDEQLKKKSK